MEFVSTQNDDNSRVIDTLSVLDRIFAKKPPPPQEEVSEEDKNIIKEVFSSMTSLHSSCPLHDPDNDRLIRNWVCDRKLGCFYNGKYWGDEKSKTTMVINVCSKEELAIVSIASDDDIKLCNESAKDIYPEWSKDPSRRASALLRIAAELEKQKRLFSMMESACTGKPFPYVLSQELPNFIKSFRDCAIWLRARGNLEGFEPPVQAQIRSCPKNYPSLVHSWRVAPALAAGSTVLLEVDSVSALSALFLAEIVREETIQDGIFAVITIDRLKTDTNLPLDPINYDGGVSSMSNPYSFYIPNFNIEILMPKPSCALVFERCDMNSAVAAIFKMYCVSFLQLYEGGCKIMVQDSLKDVFISKLKDKFKHYKPEKCLVGSGFTNPFIHTDAAEQTEKVVFETKVDGAMPISTFRTITEAINIFNQEMRGINASVWGEDIATVLEITKKLQTSNIWVNICNMYDNNICFGSVYNTGNFLSGGTMGIYSHYKQCLKPTPYKSNTIGDKISDIGKIHFKYSENFNLYIGGILKPPFHQKYIDIKNCMDQDVAGIPAVTIEDVGDAVGAAVGAFAMWSNRIVDERIKALLQIAKHLEDEQHEFVATLSKSTYRTPEECFEEIQATIDRIRYWACNSNMMSGFIKGTDMYGRVLETYEPLGVIGIVCPDEYPLLNLISLMIPCVMSGNTTVVIPSKLYPAPGMKLAKQILSEHRALAGVINIIPSSDSVVDLVKYEVVEAIWAPAKSCFDEVELHSYGKKQFVIDDRDWLSTSEGQSIEILLRSVYCKNVWLPMGSFIG